MSGGEVLAAGPLRVRFHRLGDRIAHAIEWAGGPSPRTLLNSIEGDPDQDWPPSPPLQELHFETRPDGQRLALLVGMAGHSHWSASIALDAAGTALEFDLACRLRETPNRLGNQYHWGANVQGEPSAGDRHRCMLRFPEGIVLVVALPAGEAPPPALAPSEAGLTIAPPLPDRVGAQTVRWRWRLAECGESGRAEPFVVA